MRLTTPTRYPGRPGGLRPTIVAAALLTCVVFLHSPALAQFHVSPGDINADAKLTEYPTIDGILQARRAGHPPERILQWIREQHAHFDLSLDQAAQLRAQGLESSIIAAMAGMPTLQVDALLKNLGSEYVARPGPREGLSKRHLLRMLNYGVPENEMLSAIAKNGSSAELSLHEAQELLDKGASPRLVVAIGRGIVPPEAAAAKAPGSRAGSAAPAKEAPLLDDVLAGAAGRGAKAGATPPAAAPGGEASEAPTLDEIAAQAGVNVVPKGGPLLDVMSDPPGAEVLLAPGGTRLADFQVAPKSVGNTPAEISTDPGDWLVFVRKPLDDFDASIVPAVRTVHDADGTTRTLIYNGTVYYDAQDCCEARGVGNALQITRVMEDHPGLLLGDEFDGMPPYLWDGNRYLLLTIENGRIVEVTKVYRIVRATDEERTLMATFVPSSLNPLEQTPTLEAVSTRARMTWSVPDTATLSALAKINGVPESDVQAIEDRLQQVGKAVWKSESDSGVHIVSFELDTLGRLRLDRVDLDRKGFDGELATPAPPAPPPTTAKSKEEAPPGPAPLPEIRRIRETERELPLLQVTNNRKSAAEVRLEDGTVILVDAGQEAESMVTPGTWAIDVQFESGEPAKMTGTARLAARARYTLELD